MLAVHVSGTECIALLERLGFRIFRRGGGLATLRRGLDCVVVPESATLGPALVGMVLRAARIDPLDFMRAIDAEAASAASPPSSSAMA